MIITIANHNLCIRFSYLFSPRVWRYSVTRKVCLCCTLVRVLRSCLAETHGAHNFPFPLLYVTFEMWIIFTAYFLLSHAVAHFYMRPIFSSSLRLVLEKKIAPTRSATPYILPPSDRIISSCFLTVLSDDIPLIQEGRVGLLQILSHFFS
jgi:hypothetical protein